MGGIVTKGSNRFDQIKQYEFREFGNQYGLSQLEVERVYVYFRRLSREGEDTGVISHAQFFNTLALPRNTVTQRIFNIFDQNKSNTLNFREFLIGLSVFINKNMRQKIKLTFRILDTKDQNVIEVGSFTTLVVDSLQQLHLIHLDPKGTSPHCF